MANFNVSKGLFGLIFTAGSLLVIASLPSYFDSVFWYLIPIISAFLSLKRF